MNQWTRPCVRTWIETHPINHFKKHLIWKVLETPTTAEINVCLRNSLMTIIIPSLEDIHSSINMAFVDRQAHMPQASGFLFMRATADAFIYLPQECGPSVYMPCVLLIYSVLCLCQTGGGSEWDTEGAAGSLAVPAVPLSCVWSLELAELIMDWFKVCQHKPRGPETAPCAAHTQQSPLRTHTYTHTCGDLTPAKPLLCTCTQKPGPEKWPQLSVAHQRPSLGARFAGSTFPL